MKEVECMLVVHVSMEAFSVPYRSCIVTDGPPQCNNCNIVNVHYLFCMEFNLYLNVFVSLVVSVF